MKRVIFLYWGRRGLSQFTYELAEAASRTPNLWWRLSISRQNEEFERFQDFGGATIPVDTFSRSAGAVLRIGRIASIRRTLARAVDEGAVDTVVNLMSHIWSPLTVGAFRRGNVRYVTMMHDGRRHPGDRTGIAHRLLLLDAQRADRVITLSATVRDQLIARHAIGADKIVSLFHPRLRFGKSAVERRRPTQGRLRLLFLGRIMAYKGLPQLVEALELLRNRGGPSLSLTVMGEGVLGDLGPRLAALGARVVNRWLTDEEISAALAEHDAVALAHMEASQSGIAAAALGAGVPVIAMPVGGLVEQVIDGQTGVLAATADAHALADAIVRFATAPGLYESIVAGIAESAEAQSMDTFLRLTMEVA